jgi:murein L,D-transpeptidase YcbB/YkuD
MVSTAAVTALALCGGISLHLTGTLTPWAKLGVGPATTARPDDDVVRAVPIPEAPPAPSPALIALRKELSSKLARRTDVGPAYADDLAGATSFYDALGGPLLWVTEKGLSKRGIAAIAEIQRADEWGLRARDFAVPRLPAGEISPQAAAAAEIELTFAVLKYARFARGGRYGKPSTISNLLDYTPPVRPPKDVLASIAASDAPDAYLRSLHPKHEQFEALRHLLLKLRRGDAGEWEITYGEKLQTVLPSLVRANTTGQETASDTHPEREDAEKSLRIGRILVNMERWRWMPTDLGAFHVWNNVPEFLTRVVKNGQVVHTDRIIVGQQDWPTPSFSADMKVIVFHPSWGVPDGIKRKELGPLLRKSSGGNIFGLFTGAPSSRTVLEQHKLQAYYQGRPIDPNQVDWSSANIAAYDFRQPPGPTNVLGKIKFMFPNEHDVYMHDTPERDLFARSFRGLSHGCMRVGNPQRLAEVLLAQDKGWSEQQVGSFWNGGSREVALSTRVPVHMTYFTAMVDREGKLRTFGDLYGIDTRMGAALFGKTVPFVTPRYDAEMATLRARNRPAEASSGSPSLSNLADAISDIFSP